MRRDQADRLQSWVRSLAEPQRGENRETARYRAADLLGLSHRLVYSLLYRQVDCVSEERAQALLDDEAKWIRARLGLMRAQAAQVEAETKSLETRLRAIGNTACGQGPASSAALYGPVAGSLGAPASRYRDSCSSTWATTGSSIDCWIGPTEWDDEGLDVALAWGDSL